MPEPHLHTIFVKKGMHITTNEDRAYVASKRTIDIICATVGIVILIPVFLIVALLIKKEDSKGAILFKQLRVGKDGKEFYMFKFRSMVSDAENKLTELLPYNDIEGAMFKMKEDPRITKIGKFIRKTSIDELPQLWNVIRGEMSLVGPRPPLLREVEQYNSYHKQRLIVKPGCTGLWQVSGRSNLNFNQMVELDLYYISNCSIWIDFKLMIKTVIILLKSKDAF
ncbi:sugar transferase [Fictibacillus barbaricus]|uniref:Exopolysaccharide biosynthesis polyprenyl glycosylphosphotransferase n=1 Tax=Fictibacillus barbaricus TaxID=182136 RepID=A0ABU1U1P8_9BACL|nr:sugar transferase [Fictibacillus barbaricus]MDR7073326.1 exopolysaccharide biosynthesis polyprenyl glycosylphosphotransferase [Fictibacillus barbaricus]